MKASLINLAVTFALTIGLYSPGAAGMGNAKPKNPPQSGRWDHLDPKNVIPRGLLDQATNYLDLYDSQFPNKNYLSVVDYTQHSSKKRWYLVNLKTGAVEQQLVAHGSGSEGKNSGYTPGFSNKNGTHLSSIGFYRTAETYTGSHGYSLKLDGVSATNSNARARAIVVHPADYVGPQYYPIGRSWGCLAMDPQVSRSAIDRIKGGSLIYAYGVP